MGNFLTASSILTFFACVTLGVGYAYVFYSSTQSLSKQLRLILASLRALMIALLAWLLFAPLIKLISYVPEKPLVIIAQDNSLSIANVKPKDFDQKRYERDLTTLKAKLAAKYEVKTYSFSDRVTDGLDFSAKGKLSNASAFVSQLNDELLNRNVGAIIMASDGIFNRGGNPIYELDKIKAPVYTIALGDTIPKRDVLIANINYNNLVYLDNEFTLDIQVQAYQSKGEQSVLSIAENGQRIKTANISIHENDFVQDVKVKLKANKIGVQRYTISLAAVKNEMTLKNNSQTIFVEVIDARQKVLLAAAAPHPDLSTLKQAIELNQHYEVTLAIGDELAALDPAKYSLAILYQLPSSLSTPTALINKLIDLKTPQWYIVGSQTQISGFNQVQNVLNISRANGAIQEVFPVIAPNFTTFNVEQSAIKQLIDYDPLLMPFGTLQTKGSCVALFTQRIGKVNTQNPLWFFTNDGGRKMGFLMGEGLWKWKLEEAKSDQSFALVDELIAKTVQYLAVKDDKRKFKVYSTKNTFEENEDVVLNATLYNDAYEPTTTADVKAQVKNGEGKIFNYTFSKIGAAYRLDVGALPQGNYTYTANTSLGGKTFTASGAFYVSAIIAEYQQTTANHQLLYTMSQQSSGKLFRPADLLRIEDEIEKNGTAKTISYEDRKYEQLIELKWIFVLLLCFLSLEWFLRKRNGEL